MSNVISTQAQGQLAGVTILRFPKIKKSNVVEYTTKYRNYYDRKGSPTDRRDAEFFWAYEVRNVLPKEDPKFDRLLAQVNSPANEDFWAQRMDPAAYQLRKQHEAQSGFWVFPRQPTEAESKADPGLLILGDNSRSFVLPTYNLRPLTAIEYSVFAITLIMCNPSLSITYATIVELWSTLVQKVYHFEKDDLKSAKLREADLRSGTPDDANTSTAVPTPPTTAPGQTFVQALGSGTLGVEQQLEQENALLKAEIDGLRHRVATLLGQIRSKSHNSSRSRLNDTS